ncbi:hypothetical protein GWO43_30875 [candidate division KSB1 bacterium]|nr:hypothetical protein [candidate division KSB1 bacterium]NIR73076.1 hypothetical protein [candidate division KSB1 bacterium]NIS28317.1 hypothetical protein [candidate division KSB1 bacterium]NIT75186.1 hypothetical protein [candidate division KSB1 bacterium]NIU29023.1 hypothetical protein [candidate division KSB1 bacterium]
MTKFEHKNAELVTEFDRYVIDNPELADAIPDGSLVVMQIEGDEEFNARSRELAKRQAEKNQKLMFVKIKKMRPVISRIEELELMGQI